MPGMFDIFPIYSWWILFFFFKFSQRNNRSTGFVKWMECEAISFNDVQDKCAGQQLPRQCVQQPRGRAQRKHRRAATLYVTVSCEWLTCPLGLSARGNVLVWCRFCASRVTWWNTYSIISQPRTSIYGVIFLTQTHYNSNVFLGGFFQDWSFTHYWVLPPYDVTGICGSIWSIASSPNLRFSRLWTTWWHSASLYFSQMMYLTPCQTEPSQFRFYPTMENSDHIPTRMNLQPHFCKRVWLIENVLKTTCFSELPWSKYNLLQFTRAVWW